MAREYVAAMRAVHPKGPYFLVGMCYGVHIAEQMVLELESQGHEVGFLGVIDTLRLAKQSYSLARQSSGLSAAVVKMFLNYHSWPKRRITNK